MNERYMQRGVSASKEDVHNAISKLDKGLFPKAFCKIVEDTLGNDPDFCNIMHADGAGTKSSLAYLYWKEDPYNELDSWGIPLTNGVGNVTFTGLDPGRTYILELIVRDSAMNSRSDTRERVPKGSGIALGP